MIERKQSLVNFERRSRVCSKLKEDEKTQTEAKIAPPHKRDCLIERKQRLLVGSKGRVKPDGLNTCLWKAKKSKKARQQKITLFIQHKSDH